MWHTLLIIVLVFQGLLDVVIFAGIYMLIRNVVLIEHTLGKHGVKVPKL